MVVILALLGTVAVAACVWCGHHARRELARRRQVARVRAALAGNTSVAELRARCGADSMPFFLPVSAHRFRCDESR